MGHVSMAMASDITMEGSTDNGLEIVFCGELVCAVRRALDMTEWDERELQLKLFAEQGGGFVASVAILSSNYSIRNHRESERLDNMDDVEKFFYVFDPLDFVPRKSRLTSTSASHRSAHQLSQVYGRLVDTLLRKLAAYYESHPACERVVVEDPREASRVLKFLGLA